MKKTIISSILILCSASSFSATKSEKESMYCYSVPQKQGIYMCKTWDELSTENTDDAAKLTESNKNTPKTTSTGINDSKNTLVAKVDKPKDNTVKPDLKIKAAIVAQKQENAVAHPEKAKVGTPSDTQAKKDLKPVVKPADSVKNKLTDSTEKNWMIQVALAANQEKADHIVDKLKNKGYATKTSVTTKGVRVLVGPNDYQAANELKSKLQNDNSLDAQAAWLLNWSKSKQ
ncbi:SPOR domain-containing protein [Acinetobacter sp. ME22]|uniref:SPOR domain-containing protein n=1 Tax=Acinetobacter sp. ME22 TaxID=2904802 RepID=UPI001EDA2975|nr:SPOR domain-containing protein [Acinetobacter sp. ME22]MCG2572230.1 SPOR domain-containing protein [Acinetobacter sp. ME22]